MQTSDSVPVGELAAAVSDAVRGDRSRLDALVAGASQRAEQRALDSVIASPREPTPVEPMPAPVARAIRRLTAADEDLAKKVTALQDQSDQSLLRLVDSLAALRRQVRDIARGGRAMTTTPRAGRVSTSRRGGELSARRGRAPALERPAERRHRMRQAKEARLLATRMQIQNVANVVNTLQAAAYGQKGSLLSTNNLLLAGNQLFWSLLDPVLQGLGVLDAASATVLAAYAPLGNLLGGQILFAGRRSSQTKQ